MIFRARLSLCALGFLAALISQAAHGSPPEDAPTTPREVKADPVRRPGPEEGKDRPREPPESPTREPPGPTQKPAPTKKEEPGEELAREKEQARRIRQGALMERDRFLEDYRRVTEERRRRAEEARREQHLRRVDPERDTFWRREQVTYFGREILLTVPAGTSVAIFAQRKPQQFMGVRAHVRAIKPRVRQVRLLGKEARVSDLVKTMRGNFVLIAVPEGTPATALKPGGYDLLRLNVHGASYDITNIYSDGTGFLRVEAERRNRPGEAGEYSRWTVDAIHLVP